MARAEVREAGAQDAYLLAADPRPADVVEVHAASGQTILEAAQRGLVISQASYAGFVDDELVVLFGARKPTLLSPRAVVWALGTRALDRHAVTFVRHSRRYIELMLDAFGPMENWVDARNTRAIRWLRAMGAVLDEPRPWGLLKMPFHHFEIRRDV